MKLYACDHRPHVLDVVRLAATLPKWSWDCWVVDEITTDGFIKLRCRGPIAPVDPISYELVGRLIPVGEYRA